MQEIAHASLHWIGSFVRVGHGQDGFRPNLQVVDQMGDSVGNDASLPAARTRENENRAFSGLNSFELLWIEKLTEIHVEQLLDGGLASISPQVFYRHQENSNRGIRSVQPFVRVKVRTVTNNDSHFDAVERAYLFHCNAFREVSWLIDITSAANRDVIGQNLQGNDLKDR